GGPLAQSSGALQIFLTAHRIYRRATEKKDAPQILLTGHRKSRWPVIFFRRATENEDGPLEESERRRKKLAAHRKRRRGTDSSDGPWEKSGAPQNLWTGRQLFPAGLRKSWRLVDFFRCAPEFSDAPQILLTGHRKSRRPVIFFR